MSLLTSIVLPSSRILIGYYIWTDYSKFGLILNSSKTRLGNKPILTKQIGVDILCQAQRDSVIN